MGRRRPVTCRFAGRSGDSPVLVDDACEYPCAGGSPNPSGRRRGSALLAAPVSGYRKRTAAGIPWHVMHIRPRTKECPVPAPRWLGLTATAYRRDGLGRIIFMHCGPKRHVSPMADKTDTDSMARIVQVQLRAA
jgi:hypothetical protein